MSMIQYWTLIINPVNYYLIAATNNRLLISEGHGDSNRCTPCRRKPDQHDMYASHASRRTPGVRFLRAVPYVTTFRESSTGLDRCTAPGKKCSWLHLSAGLSGPRDPPQFLSQHNHWSSALKPSTCRWQTTRLTGPISPACDRYVQYLLTGTNPSILNRHRWSYHRENLRIDTSLSPPFPSEGITDPPNDPVQYQIIQTTFTNWTEEGTSPKSHEWEPPLDFYCNLSSKHSMS
jgi:hypothetical protein